VTPDRETWLQGLYATQRRLTAVLRRLLGVQQQRFEWLKRRLNQLHPGVQLRQRAQRLDELEQRLLRALQFNLEQRKRLLGTRMAQLQQLSPALRLAKARSRLNELHHKLQALILKRYEQSRSRLALATRSLNTLSPLATLTRGYAIVTDAQGHVVVDAGKLSMVRLFLRALRKAALLQR